MPMAHSVSDVNLYVNDVFDWLLSLYGFQVVLQIPTSFHLLFNTISCALTNMHFWPCTYFNLYKLALFLRSNVT